MFVKSLYTYFVRSGLMAFFQADFFSQALCRVTSFNIILPNDLPADRILGYERHHRRGMKALYLLHGYTGDNKDWLVNSMISDLAGKYNLAVVFPSGENSFYVDGKGAGKQYGQYIGSELVDYTRKVFGLSANREDTFIGGLSMGGFGALRNALKYNQTFGKVFALSSALIIHKIEGMQSGDKDAIADYHYYHSVFGDLNALDESDVNPEHLAKNIIKDKGAIPDIYMACGKEDFLINENRAFKLFLDNNGIPVHYTEGSGIHDWNYWNSHLEPAIKWLLNIECDTSAV